MIELEYNDNEFPQRLKLIKKAPQKIYVQGNTNLLNDVGIAIIGSRHNSDYGKRMCQFFTKELVQYGVTIISGMAEGIDTIAHKTCLQNGGNTIAVLPCGFNQIFPKTNIGLFKDIINLGGATVSEYLPDIKANSKKFLERNRIVAGLSIGTLVIEGGYRSGTSVTARITKEQEKSVFCVPSSLENHRGVTCNRLIQEGAKLVTCVEDILEEFPEIRLYKKKIVFSDALIDDEYIDVYNVLSYKPQYINEIAKKSQNSINDTNYKLMMLELEEHVVQLPGKNFIRK